MSGFVESLAVIGSKLHFNLWRSGGLAAMVLGAVLGVVATANPASALDIVDASQPESGPPPRYTNPPGPKIGGYVNRPDSFFQTAEGKTFVDNMVGWQNQNGGWFKNFSYTMPRPAVLAVNPSSGPPGDDDSVWHQVSTFDNDCTYSEMRVLARAYRVLKDPAYKAAFDKALDYCFAAQYANGGWPQRFPLQDNYGANITFNDDAMLGVMLVLKDVVDKSPDFTFCSEEQRAKSKAAFDRGVECILKCQYVQKNGTLTVWGQQHDPKTYALAGGRKYELPSLTGNESADVLELLEGIENPDARVRKSIEAGVAWYEAVKITGKRIENVQGQGRMMVDDPAAPPMWARFYDAETNRPFVAGRDGVPRARLEDISAERRNGYNWFNASWGTKVREDYQAWKTRMAANGAGVGPGK